MSEMKQEMKHESIVKEPYEVVENNELNMTIRDEKTGKAETVHKNNINKFT